MEFWFGFFEACNYLIADADSATVPTVLSMLASGFVFVLFVGRGVLSVAWSIEVAIREALREALRAALREALREALRA